MSASYRSFELIAERKTTGSRSKDIKNVLTSCDFACSCMLKIYPSLNTLTRNSLFTVSCFIRSTMKQRRSIFVEIIEYIRSLVLECKGTLAYRYVNIAPRSSQGRQANWRMVHPLSSQGEHKSSFPMGCYTREMFYIMKISIARPRKLLKADEGGCVGCLVLNVAFLKD